MELHDATPLPDDDTAFSVDELIDQFMREYAEVEYTKNGRPTSGLPRRRAVSASEAGRAAWSRMDRERRGACDRARFLSFERSFAQSRDGGLACKLAEATSAYLDLFLQCLVP
jgi:hypothetical protein